MVKLGDRAVGEGQSVFVIAEAGINHNGDVELAKRLITAAHAAGCNAVKFQKRTPEISVPVAQREQPRETPWGIVSYLEYRRRMEFGLAEFTAIHEFCRSLGLLWFASCWDEPSVDFIERFDPPCHKIASASLTNDALLHKVRSTGRPVILSTGMSTPDQIRHAVSLLDREKLLMAHSTSAYPCQPAELNLLMIQTLRREYSVPVGYSGHEVGLQTTCAAVVLGACFVERHITLDRAMWGSDHAASVEPHGFSRLVRDIRVIESALGDGVKRIYPSEERLLRRLRGA